METRHMQLSSSSPPERRASRGNATSQRSENTSHGLSQRQAAGWPSRLNHISWICSPSSPPALTDIFSSSSTVLSAIGLTTGLLIGRRFYKRYWRRIPSASYVSPNWFRQRTIFGRVTSVGDGDNFRLYHTPGGKWTGWGWLPGRQVPTKRSALKDNTIHIRLAGVDAPELPHFGRPGQPFGEEARQWLTEYIKGRSVRVVMYKADQYGRIVGTTYVRRGLFQKDVGHEMLKSGFATVYEALSGAEFGGKEEIYRKTAEDAQRRGVGMWAKRSRLKEMLGVSQTVTIETPGQFKQRIKSSEG